MKLEAEDWESTKYAKWYKSHRRFSFTAKFCIELYEERNTIPQTIFVPFLKSLYCHSKSEEKMFRDIQSIDTVFHEHDMIQLSKHYTEEEKYMLCKSLLLHMKEEETLVMGSLLTKSAPHELSSQSMSPRLEDLGTSEQPTN